MCILYHFWEGIGSDDYGGWEVCIQESWWYSSSTNLSPDAEDQRVCARSVMSNCLWPHGVQPTRLPCSWSSPGKNTGVGFHFLLQGIFPTQGSNHVSGKGRQIVYHCTTWESLEGQWRPMTQLKNPQAKRKSSFLFSLLFYSVLLWLIGWGPPILERANFLLNFPTQILISSRNILTDTPRNNVV